MSGVPRDIWVQLPQNIQENVSACATLRRRLAAIPCLTQLHELPARFHGHTNPWPAGFTDMMPERRGISKKPDHLGFFEIPALDENIFPPAKGIYACSHLYMSLTASS